MALECFKKNNKIIRSIIGVLYWLPFIMIVVMVFLSSPIPYKEWDKSIKVYLGGFVFIVYAAKIFPIILLLFDDFRRLLQLIYRGIFRSSKQKDLPDGNKINRRKMISFFIFVCPNSQ